MAEKIAAILIRGLVKVKHDVKLTVKNLNLFNKNNCVILDKTPEVEGMLSKAKDYITYGPVSEETIKGLEKRRKIGDKTYVLSPPRGGFEREGIKVSYRKGGALGPRDNMDKLISKML